MNCIVLPIDCTTLPMEYVQQFDVLGTDPPYSKKVHAKAVSCSASGGKSLGVVERDFGFAYLTPKLRRWLGRASASVKRWSLIYSDRESVTWLRISCEAAGAEYIRSVPWVRWSQPQLSGDRPPSGAEDLIVCHRQEDLMVAHRQHVGKRGGRRPIAKEWNGPGNLLSFDAFKADSLRGDEKYSAEKPLDDALRQVSYFSRPGESWFDPCAGTATFGRACQILGRRYVGCEKYEEAYGRAIARLSAPLSYNECERLQRYVDEVGENMRRLLAQTSLGPEAQNARRRCEDALSDVQRARDFLSASPT